MNNANAYTFGWALGYVGAWTTICIVMYLLLAPFNYGYVGAELMGAYSVWCTIKSWDQIVAMYQDGLTRYQ